MSGLMYTSVACLVAITALPAQVPGSAPNGPTQPVLTTKSAPAQPATQVSAPGSAPTLSVVPQSSARPVFLGKPLPGKKADTQSWIVHFKSRPFTLAAFRAEMYGDRNVERVAAIVADLDTKMKAHQAPLQEAVEALGGSMTHQYWICNACCIEIAPQHLAAIRAMPNVDYLQPDTECVPLIKTATNTSNHKADTLQAANQTGANIGVAIIDGSFDNNMNNTGKVHITFSRRGNTTSHRICIARKMGSQPFDLPVNHGTGVASIAGGWKWKTSTADHGHSYDANFALYSLATQSNGNTSTAVEAAAWNSAAKDAVTCKTVSGNMSYSSTSNTLAVENKAMDSCALNADIVVCTAAGNGGSNVSSSPTNINGLSVAAVNENSHTLASFSSRGMQNGRYFPNISANGVSTNMAKMNNEATDYVDSGTSMASPQVCGAVGQIRGINTKMKSDETCAVMLAGTQANTGSTSTIKVAGVGAGYMDNVASRTICLDAQRHGRATLSATTKTWTRKAVVPAGNRFQFAAKWHRHNVASNSWSNINVKLTGPATVDSNSPSNTEEFVRWTNTSKASATVTVTVTLVALGSGAKAQTYGWGATHDMVTSTGLPGTFVTYGVGCKGSGSGPGGGGNVILPTASRTAIGNSNNVFGAAYQNQRYQQVHVGTQVGSARSFKGHAFRPGNRKDASVTRTIQIRMGHTTKTPANLTTTFASNITSAQTLVLNKKVVMPAMVPSTVPSVFALKVPWSSNWAWSGAKGQNLLYEYRCSDTTSAAYYPNAVSGNKNVSRLWGTGPTATTGSLGLNYGLCIAFAYSAPAGNVILPTASRTAIGNSNNVFGAAYANQRYQQVHVGTQVGSARSFKAHAFRPGARKDAAATRTIQIRMGHTTKTPANLTTSFASNITSAQTLVVNAKVVMPAMVPSTNPSVFALKVPWSSNWAWTGAKGQNLLYEYRCSDTTSAAYYPNAVSGNKNVSRMWGTGPNATTGSLGLNYGLCIAFEYGSTTKGAIPAMGNTGVPFVAQTFNVNVSQAAPARPCILWLGMQANVNLGFGCTLLATNLATLGVALSNGAGSGTVAVGIPNVAGFKGLKFWTQWWVLDNGGAWLNALAFSNGGAATVGGN